MTIETTYEGYVIRYDERSDEWYCHDFDARSTKLSELKKRLDKLGSDEKKFERFQAYINPYGTWKLVTVTSNADYNQVWTIDDEKHRAKIHRGGLYKFSAENKERIERMESIEQQRTELRNRIDEISEQMELIAK